MDYILELNNIKKEFSGITALDNVNFKLKHKEIHALMGENGAGKSTFIKVITGVYKADKGEIYINGQLVTINGPKDATKLGITAIYQNVTNFPHLSITENIFMSHTKVGLFNKILWKNMHEEAKHLLGILGFNINPKALMGELSIAQQQIVEIAKAISSKAKIIIMDEPTASLTAKESERLYTITEKLRDQGTAIIFISHRFEDMYRLASRVTVLRDSKYIGSWHVNEISNEGLIEAMIGRKITQVFPAKESNIEEEIFKVNRLSKKGYFKDISFTLRKGEILGITGLVGAGRTEVFQSIFGIFKIDSGEIYLEGREISPKNPQQAIKLGLGYLSEDRGATGLVIDWEIGKNITLPVLNKVSSKGIINTKSENILSKQEAEKMEVKAKAVFTLVSQLSGGNQQKVALAKLLSTNLKVIILDEPTKGIDIGSKASIYKIINSLTKLGYGIILISSEMPEILGLSDTIIVMKSGRIVKTMVREDATSELILEAAMEEVV